MRRMLIVVLLCAALPVEADEPTTLFDFVEAVREVVEITGFPRGEEELVGSEDLDAYLAFLESTEEYRIGEAISDLSDPDAMTLSRQRRDRYDFDLEAVLADPEAAQHIDGVLEVLTSFRLYEDLKSSVGDEEARKIHEPITEVPETRLSESLEEDKKRLKRFEKKFGPRAPKLNALEVGLNFIAQRFPGFRPTEEGPGALEVIASYDTAYLTVADDEPEVVSTAGFGLRYYLLGDGWGEKGGLAGMLKPGYASVGVLVAPNEDGALVWPWQGEERIGGFVTWGPLKVAYVGGDEERFMVSREFQAIPWLF